jgi:hypothetical protein
MVFTPQVDRTLVSKRKALEHEDKDSAAECRVECPGQAPKELIAGAEDNELFLLEMLRGDALAARLEKVKDLAAAGNSLTVEQLLDKPEDQRGFAELAVGEEGRDVEKVPDFDELGGVNWCRCLARVNGEPY